MTSTRLPAVIDALVALFTAALPDTCQVIDGPPLEAVPGDYLAVGWSPLTTESASAPQTIASATGLSREEAISVTCWLDSAGGDASDIRTRRLGAYALLAVIESALRSDNTLGGTVNAGWLVIGDNRLVQEQTESGCVVGVEFSVVGKSRI